MNDSALGVITSFLFTTFTIAFYIGFGLHQPIWLLWIAGAWLVFFVVVLLYDMRHWGRPSFDTQGVRIYSRTRNLGLEDHETEGTVMGTCVKARNIFSSARAEMRAIIGGEAKQFTALVDEARNVAITRMCKQAKARGCDSIYGFRLITAETLWGSTEFIAYGTAVRSRKE